MSELRTLHHRLDLLVQGSVTISDGERLLVEDGEYGVLEAMRAEIAETQLPRRLVFRKEDLASIAFDVTAGRVLAYLEPASDASGPQSILAGAQDVAAISKAISAFSVGAQRLTVRAIRLDKTQETFDFGASVDAIFALCPDPVGTPEAETSLTGVDCFFQASKALSPGSILLKRGEVTGEHGSTEILDRLHRLMKTEHLRNMVAMAVQADQIAPSQCAIYAGYPSEKHELMCVFQAGTLGLITYRHDALDAIVALWKSHTT